MVTPSTSFRSPVTPTSTGHSSRCRLATASVRTGVTCSQGECASSSTTTKRPTKRATLTTSLLVIGPTPKPEPRSCSSVRPTSSMNSRAHSRSGWPNSNRPDPTRRAACLPHVTPGRDTRPRCRATAPTAKTLHSSPTCPAVGGVRRSDSGGRSLVPAISCTKRIKPIGRTTDVRSDICRGRHRPGRGFQVRRLIASSFVVLAITVVLATPSLAANTAPVLQKPLTDVPFSGTSNFAFSSHSCSFVFETYDLTFEMRHSRTGTIHIEGCVNSSGAFPGGFGFESGTFTLSTGGHGKDSTLQGTVSGSI